MKLTHLAKNQSIVETDDKIFFQSYETVICEIDKKQGGKITVTKGQPQSKTTAKYLNKFLQLHTNVNNYKNL